MARNGRNAKSPAFQFYPGDFLSDPNVAAMSTEAQGAYIRLLCFAWLDGSIPADVALLAPMCGLAHDSFTKAWAVVQRCWTESSTGRLVNPRLERERVFQAEGRARRQLASQVAVEAKQRIVNESSTNRATVDPLTLHPTPDTLRPKPDTRHPIPDTRDPKPVLEKQPRAPRTGPHAELIQFWERLWLETRGTPYAVETKDGVAASAVLKLASGSLQEAQRRAERLLRSSDAWMTQNASLGLLRSRWNQLAFDVVGSKNEPKGAQGIRDYMARHHGGSNERGS
jgi:uncharacterized protein YdaU (DUF1376 family)